MTFDLPTVSALVAHYQAIQGLADETFEVSLVPGLSHEGAPAWATMSPDPARPKTTIVRVRDLAQTPIPGFTGGTLWNELKVTISHELWHVWVNRLLENPTVENEEALVEAAALAVVRSAGADARVMARSVERWAREAPERVRARLVKVSARNTRARGGCMDPDTIKQLIAAIKAQDGEAALAICEKALTDQATSNAGGGAPPAPASPVDGGATDMRAAPPMPPKPGAKPGEDAAGPPESDDARKARKAAMDEDTKTRARLVAAANEAEKSTGILRTTTIRARIAEARTVDKATISAEAEKLILASPSIDEAEIRLTLARGSAASTTQRARAVDPVTGKPVEVAPVVDTDAANVEGLSPMDLQTIAGLGGIRSGAGKTYAAEAQKTRARLAKGAQA